MKIITAKQSNEWRIFVLTDDGESLASFDLQDADAAEALFLSLLTPDELAALDTAAANARAIDAEDAANRALAYTH